MFEIIKKTLSENLNIDESKITLNARFKEDLGADSLDMLELVMKMEDEMGIELPDEELASFVTVEDAVKALEAFNK